MKTQLSIQERLKDLRVEKGMTLEQLSQQTKIPASTLGSYESDDYKEIPHRNIIELAKFYDVSTDYLLGMTENRQLDNVALSDLHLSDAALTLLKGQKSTHCSCQSLSPMNSSGNSCLTWRYMLTVLPICRSNHLILWWTQAENGL